MTRGARTRPIAFLIIDAVFIALLAGSSGCKDAGMKDFVPEIHHAATYPQCTYALFRDPAGCDESTVLYYFHGTGGNETTWLQANRAVIDEWRARKVMSPLVVGITFGEDWLMFPGDVSSRSVNLDAFVGRCMPEIEGRLGGKVLRRLVYGFSIGGANAAQLFFRHPRLFEKAAIISPQLYLFPIHDPGREIDALAKTVRVRSQGPLNGLKNWIRKNILKRDIVAINIRAELSQMKRNVPDPARWARADILKNIERAPAGGRSSVYISCGRDDENGFFPGAERLAKIAAERGYITTFDPLEGDHMTLPESRIASFLKE